MAKQSEEQNPSRQQSIPKRSTTSRRERSRFQISQAIRLSVNDAARRRDDVVTDGSSATMHRRGE